MPATKAKNPPVEKSGYKSYFRIKDESLQGHGLHTERSLTVAKTLKRIDAGGIKVDVLTYRRSRYDTPDQRAAKQKASSAAQRRMNQIYSYQKLELVLAMNYPTAGSGLVVTLTYDDAHMPKDRPTAQARLKYFLQKLRKARKAAGLPEPVVVGAPEILTSDSGRWHHHIVIDNTGNDLDMLRSCWIYGNDVQAKKLRVDEEKNHETLARYMSKELRECQEYESRPGLHSWSCTRNAKRPEVDTITVDDDYEIAAPEGSTVLMDYKDPDNPFSSHIIKYRFDSARIGHKAPRARRRRRQRC